MTGVCGDLPANILGRKMYIRVEFGEVWGTTEGMSGEGQVWVQVGIGGLRCMSWTRIHGGMMEPPYSRTLPSYFL